MPKVNLDIDTSRLNSDTLNPYKMALLLFGQRLLWDLDPKSWLSRRRLNALKDSRVGRKCVIMCNGPSLNKVDFELLEASGIYTFGLNKINLLFVRTTFRPNCIVAVNPHVIEQNSDFYNKTDIPLFISTVGKKLINQRLNVNFLHEAPVTIFARDCKISVNCGGTVTYAAMQLAYHMGFKEVALVGCDHNFATKGPANMAVKSGAIDNSHFDPNYFSGGVVWQLPDIAKSEFSYHMAENTFRAFGRVIYNCTEGGELNVFERKRFCDFISDQ